MGAKLILGDNLAFSMLSGIVYNAVGSTRRRPRLAGNPSRSILTLPLCMAAWRTAYIYLDRLAEAESVIQMASDRKLKIPDLLLVALRSGLLKTGYHAHEPGRRGGNDQNRKTRCPIEWPTFLAYFGQLQAGREGVASCRGPGHESRAARRCG